MTSLRILFIGGTGVISTACVARAIALGHDVTVLNRGSGRRGSPSGVREVVADIRAPDDATLDLYCDRVASAVGRLSVRIFGMGEADGIALAHHLGRALQLTNILRDIDEDAARNRLYLPREKLAAIGLTAPTPQAAIDHPRIGEVCIAVAGEAEAHYAKTWDIIAKCPRKVTKAPRLMAAAYRLYLDAVLARGWAKPRARVKPGKLALLGVVLRHGIV